MGWRAGDRDPSSQSCRAVSRSIQHLYHDPCQARLIGISTRRRPRGMANFTHNACGSRMAFSAKEIPGSAKAPSATTTACRHRGSVLVAAQPPRNRYIIGCGRLESRGNRQCPRCGVKAASRRAPGRIRDRSRAALDSIFISPCIGPQHLLLEVLDVPLSGRNGEWAYYMRRGRLCRRRYVMPNDPRWKAWRRIWKSPRRTGSPALASAAGWISPCNFPSGI